MDDLLARDAVPEGYRVEIFDGEVIMTPQSPEQDWTVNEVRSAVRKAAVPRERVFGDVLVRFPGENDAAPDLTILAEGAERHGDSYDCMDVLAAVEVTSRPDDDKDYVRNVAKYARFGIELYLIADPFKKLCTLMTEPHATGYAKVKEIPYGEPLTLTLSSGERIEIDTSDFPVRD
ncbi:Uma2 family endonuclease [Streptomyces sp. 891-h]|uniref:Uma2 family endonuclease n=1 Tax=unclassified Streptomyces TaxID=2593676 RepID=UPI001FA94582|nr:Uma2 family endonuclease [Streptomyces sp. 891-h]UNZ21734.1 Uma2 family endonuclease [Streptomyces sp. 891-h]